VTRAEIRAAAARLSSQVEAQRNERYSPANDVAVLMRAVVRLSELLEDLARDERVEITGEHAIRLEVAHL
jgi:hypothetical protein